MRFYDLCIYYSTIRFPKNKNKVYFIFLFFLIYRKSILKLNYFLLKKNIISTIIKLPFRKYFFVNLLEKFILKTIRISYFITNIKISI
jgi:hypothetical protein